MSGKRLYTCNYNYFDVIDSEDKAYWLGFLFADGCVMHSTRKRILKTKISWQDRYFIKLSLSVGDINHLKKFLKAIDGTYPINIYEERSNLVDTIKKYGRILIEDRHMFDSLVNNGLCERKSLVAEYPNIQSKFDDAFIRGYFDGDGCVSYSSDNWECNITSTKEMLESIYSKLPFNKNKQLKLFQRFPERDTNSWCLRFGGNKQCFTVLDWLYNSSTENTRLERKYNKYLEIAKLNGRSI